ncbi:Chlorophyll a-b binding protein CP24 10B [Hibiscus syriacus]|uniref:Chlorophyll a-b binding protein, chloroplastic n=1 Tax=Hibiscus syriacus TaxID=106335 RepID=A0A6A3BXY3_HIBSY|nr:Chlorophyll a-b binding protein CP24 10B [Hibiscus syriacus]
MKKVMHMLFCAFGPDIYEGVSSCSNANELWNKLEEIHGDKKEEPTKMVSLMVHEEPKVRESIDTLKVVLILLALVKFQNAKMIPIPKGVPILLYIVVSIPSVPTTSNGIPGDYGFDPLSLGMDPTFLKWYREAELIHERWAMAALLGIFIGQAWSGIPWFEAGADPAAIAPFSFVSVLGTHLILIGWVESKRWVDFFNLESQCCCLLS